MPRPLAMANGKVGELTLPLAVPVYTVATLPAAATYPSSVAFVSDAPGGFALCYTDAAGTDWFNARTGASVTNRITIGNFVGGNGSQSAAGATTSATTTSTGSTFLVVVGTYGSSVPTITVTDSKGNTYTAATVAIRNTADGMTLRAYLCVGGTGGSGHTFTVSTDNNNYCAIAACEIKGSTGVIDGTPVTATATSSTIATGNLTTTNAHDIVLGIVSVDASAFPAPASSANLTMLGSVPGQSTNVGVGIAYQLVSTTVTTNAQFSGGGTTVDMCAGVLALKSA